MIVSQRTTGSTRIAVLARFAVALAKFFFRRRVLPRHVAGRPVRIAQELHPLPAGSRHPPGSRSNAGIGVARMSEFCFSPYTG